MTVTYITPAEFSKITIMLDKAREIREMSKDPALPLSLADKLALIAASKALWRLAAEAANSTTPELSTE